jgi:hypothetical protein
MILKIIFSILIATAVSTPAVSQEPKLESSSEIQELREIAEQDRRAMEAIVLYPEEDRIAIFKACMYPETIVKLNRIRTRAIAGFESATATLNKQEQAALRTAVRNPEALKALSAGGSREQILAGFKNVPNDLALAAVGLISREEGKKAIAATERLYNDALLAMDEVIAAHPEDTRNAMKHLLRTPEVFAILADFLDQTVLVGAIYKKDPEFAIQRSAELHNQALDRNQKNLQDWYSSFQKNPNLWKEMKTAANTYAQQSGTAGSSSAKKSSDPFWLYSAQADQKSNIAAYDWGFSIGADGKAVLRGLPSGAFTTWVLSQPAGYDQLKAFFTNFYQSHSAGVSGFHAAMRTTLLEETSKKSLLQQAAKMNLNPTVAAPDAAPAELPPGLVLGPPEPEEVNYQALDYFRYSTALKVRENAYGIKY